jgi:hypothetical protein
MSWFCNEVENIQLTNLTTTKDISLKKGCISEFVEIYHWHP